MLIEIIQGKASSFPSTNLQITDSISNMQISGIKHYYASVQNDIQTAISDLGWDFTENSTTNPSDYKQGNNVTVVNLGGTSGAGTQTVNLDLDLNQEHLDEHLFVVVVYADNIKKPGKRSSKAVSDDKKKEKI